ncbi:MAG: hypothetical protein RR034_09040, partial [Bacteroidales bacterium]
TNTVWNRIADYSFENNKIVVIGILIGTVILLFFAKKVRFEDDMNKINYMTEAQREAFKQLSGTTTLSKQLTYCVAEGATMEDALQQYEQLLPTMDSLSKNGFIFNNKGITPFLPSKKLQKEKLDRWNGFWAERKGLVRDLLTEEGAKIGFKPDAFKDFYDLLDRPFKVESPDYFMLLQGAFLKEFMIEKEGRSAILTLLYSTPEHASKIEKVLSQTENTFCFNTKTLTQNMLSELSFDFNYLLWICGLVVLLFLLISFGRVEITFITFLPMCVAFTWILGLMGMFDIRFNIINIILATFIFGIGDDYSIFIMEGLMYEYTYGKKMLSTYKTAVILSAVTMLI